MKKILMLMLIITSAFAATWDISSTTLAAKDSWVADMLYHEPYPTTYPAQLQPGQSGIWLDVAMKNYNYAQYQNITGVLEVTGPFEGMVTKAEIARADPQETVHAFYQLNVKDDAKPGEYKMRHRLSYSYLVTDDNGAISSIKVDSVRTITVVVYHSERVEIKDISLSPAYIIPGEETRMTVLLENTGSVAVNDIMVGYQIVTDPTIMNLLPVGYSSQRVASILPGKTATAEFTVKALDTATVKGYKAIVGAIYTSSGVTTNTTQETAIDIRGKPKIRLAGVQTDKSTITAGQIFSLSVQLENIGTGNAKSVRTVLSDSTIDGILTSYVGTIDASDTGSAIFDLRDTSLGRRTVTATVTYEDAYSNQYTDKMTAEYYITEAKTDFTMPILALAAIILAGAWYWRGKQKKKRIEQLVK